MYIKISVEAVVVIFISLAEVRFFLTWDLENQVRNGTQSSLMKICIALVLKKNHCSELIITEL